MEILVQVVTESHATLKTLSTQETRWLKEICQAFLSLGLEPAGRNALAQQIVDAVDEV